MLRRPRRCGRAGEEGLLAGGTGGDLGDTVWDGRKLGDAGLEEGLTGI